mgnify:CR=1 FL=1
MERPAGLNERIVESLYCEGLVLSDDVRAAFDLGDAACADAEDLSRIALSCEALRTTTRMMHAVAWLLNHRAYHRGEISELQLRRHGQLKGDFPHADPVRLRHITPEIRDLIASTERFYDRLVRLDTRWRDTPMAMPPVARMRQSLSRLTH